MYTYICHKKVHYKVVVSTKEMMTDIVIICMHIPTSRMWGPLIMAECKQRQPLKLAPVIVVPFILSYSHSACVGI